MDPQKNTVNDFPHIPHFTWTVYVGLCMPGEKSVRTNKNQHQTRTTPKGWARAAAALSRTAHLKFVLPCNTLY